MTVKDSFPSTSIFLKPTINISALAILYFVCAKIALTLAFVNPSATAVWPPTGIALAALILFGYRLWPGIFIGAFIANITTAGSSWTSFGIATGNTLEAVLGAYLVDCFARGRRAFDRPQDVLKFAGLAGLLSTAVSATIGVTTLYLGGLANLPGYQRVWLTWWLGDIGGALIVAPLLILWYKKPRLIENQQAWREYLIAFGLLTFVGYLGFASFPADEFRTASIAFLSIPILLWIAVRLGGREAITAVFLISTIAVWGSLTGYGPFFRANRNESLLLLQEFGAMIALMNLMLSAAISSRKRSEQALRESEQKAHRHLAELQTIYRSAPVGLGLTDRDLRFISVNEALAEMDGISASDHIGHALTDILSETLAAKVAPLYRRVLDTGEPVVNLEVMGATRSRPGVKRIWSVNYYPVGGGDNSVTGVSIMVQDITARKHTDEVLETRVRQQNAIAVLGELALCERDLQQVLNRASVIVAETLKVEYCKVLELLPGGTEMLLRAGVGWQEGLIGKATVSTGLDSQAGYTLVSGAPVVVKDLREEKRFNGPPLLVDHEVISGMSSVISGTGSTPWGVLGTHSTRQIQFTSDDVNFLLAVANVLSNAIQRKKAEVALHESEERFRSLVSVITDVLWVTDASGAFIEPQLGWEAYTGQQREDYRDFGWANAVHPDDRDRIKEVWWRAIESRTLYHAEGRLWHGPTQKWRHFVAKATPLLNADGNVREWVGTCTDIDDQKRAKDELEETVTERTKELVQAYAQLLRDVEERKALEEQLLQAQKMESIGTLAGGIAHDFNNILNIVQSYATSLHEDGSLNSRFDDGLKVINETIDRGSALVQQLLTLGRKRGTQLEPVNANTLVDDLVALISQTFPKTIEFAADLEQSLPLIMADKNQISQALLNLCVNARDAMPEGGKLLIGTSVVDGAEIIGHVQEAKGNRFVCVRLTDTGEGMDEQTKSRIFEPFFTTKMQGQGTGLGLSVVYGIVTNHAGFVDVESSLGGGSTFRVYLPIAGASVEHDAIESKVQDNREASPAEAGRTILFVDDEERQLLLMQRVLERKGYRVLTARDGAEAVEVHERHKDDIALIVLDLGLPKLNGWQALQRMRELQPDLKVLLATGFLSPEIEAEISTGQRVGVIQKPYRIDEALKEISSAIKATELEIRSSRPLAWPLKTST